MQVESISLPRRVCCEPDFLDQGHPLRNLGICRAVPPSRLARGRRLVYVYAVARRCFIAMKVNKSLASNEDWKAWGKLDLLYGVATIRERAKHASGPVACTSRRSSGDNSLRMGDLDRQMSISVPGWPGAAARGVSCRIFAERRWRDSSG